MKYGAQQSGDQSMADQLKPLSDKLDINKIAEIKKKILSNRSSISKIYVKLMQYLFYPGERESRWTVTKENEAQLDPGMRRRTGDF